jgi:eukaryotic-like serine/threonine-protein kinase
LMVGALAATAAAAGGVLLWNERQQAAQPENPGVAPVATRPPASPAPANAGGLAAPTGAARAAPASAQPAPTGDGAMAQTTASSVVNAGGPPPAAPTEAVMPASGTVPAPPPASGDKDAPEAASTGQTAVTTRLQLFVLPPVDVSLDGKRLGRTPMAVPLAPGAYTLELSNPAKGVRTTRAITVRPEGTTIQRILLGRGSVQVRAPAGSRIFLDGRKVGPKLSLFEGEHQLVVTSGKARWEKSFRLEPKQKVTFDVEYQTP